MTSRAQSPLNLLNSPWLPFRRRSGRVEWAAPDWIVNTLEDDPFVGFAWGRADFDAAAHEFMIGLLSTALAPEDDVEWRARWCKPPSSRELSDCWHPLVPYFDLDGPGPRFLQDHDELDGAEEKDVANLLIDAPGENTIELNIDHFVKRGLAPVLGRPAVAMALFTLQSYAPGGGKGHRASLRGGGPLTTLVDDPSHATLWHRLWLGVETRNSIANRNAASQLPFEPKYIFPWIVPTRTSDPQADGRETTPADVHALQVYWGMPRRIRLVFEPAEGRRCALTGCPDQIAVRSYRTRTYGTKYTDNFVHPLTPYRRKRNDEPWRPLHGEPGGVGYRHWLGLLVTSTNRMSQPAAAVRAALARCAGNPYLQLEACGYDMDRKKLAKVRSFSSGFMPIIGLTDPDRRDLIRALSEALILATDQAVRLILGALKAALFGTSADIRGDLSFYGERLWRQTEAAFYGILRKVSELDPDDEKVERQLCEQWRGTLEVEAMSLFDEVGGVDALDIVRMERVATARRNLVFALKGYGKGGYALFKALRLPAPKPRKDEMDVTREARA